MNRCPSFKTQYAAHRGAYQCSDCSRLLGRKLAASSAATAWSSTQPRLSLCTDKLALLPIASGRRCFGRPRQVCVTGGAPCRAHWGRFLGQACLKIALRPPTRPTVSFDWPLPVRSPRAGVIPRVRTHYLLPTRWRTSDRTASLVSRERCLPGPHIGSSLRLFPLPITPQHPRNRST